MRLLLLMSLVCFTSAYYMSSITSGGIEYVHYADGEDSVSFCLSMMACQREGSTSVGNRLAMIKTSTIQSAIYTLLSRTSWPLTWIGASDMRDEGQWRWLDGSSIGYSHWGDEQPNEWGDQDCMEINDRSPGLWNDNDCNNHQGYVCEVAITRAIPSDFAMLTIYEPKETAARTLWDARRECEKIGARLVKISDEQSRQKILEKLANMKNIDTTKYWMDSQESVLTQEDSEANDEGFGFICEHARPNMVKVTDEQPVVTKSEDLEISCTVSGYPVPDVVWYKDDEQVSDQTIGVASSTLRIKNASEGDAGKYVCVATNIINGEVYESLGMTVVSVIP